MKTSFLVLSVAAELVSASAFAWELDRTAMSEAYWRVWNDAEQRQIDADIDRYRKADAAFPVPAADGTEVHVEQISHAFFFGAQIFNYNQLGRPEWNRKYRELFGTLFNSATVGFYWEDFEPYPGCTRFRPGYEDSEAFWEGVSEPERQPHWRRPATDAPVDWCLQRGVRVHGHPLVWNAGHAPLWLYGQFFPQEERDRLGFPDWTYGLRGRALSAWRDTVHRPWYLSLTNRLSETAFAEAAPQFTANVRNLQEARIRAIAKHYGTRIASWDVVNESCCGYNPQKGVASGLSVTYGEHGVDAADYVLNAFRTAAEAFPEGPVLNINDWKADDKYTLLVSDLLRAGARIDVIGAQMHLFDTNICRQIAAGRTETPQSWGSIQFWEIGSPRQVRTRFGRLSRFGKPIHFSEVTISAPGTDMRAEKIQACVLWNLYRIWFSQKFLSGITWWNVVDGCGFAGEPTTSGLFRRDMTTKESYFALDDLVNRSWKTSLVTHAANGKIKFRGFKGRYRVRWKDATGKERTYVETLR